MELRSAIWGVLVADVRETHCGVGVDDCGAPLANWENLEIN